VNHRLFISHQIEFDLCLDAMKEAHANRHKEDFMKAFNRFIGRICRAKEEGGLGQ
jgi:hypothetical protein